jgi:hypothetical protein
MLSDTGAALIPPGARQVSQRLPGIFSCSVLIRHSWQRKVSSRKKAMTPNFSFKALDPARLFSYS